MEFSPGAKDTLRHEMLRRRKEMDTATVREKSRKIISRIMQMHAFRKGENILLYLPIKKEVNTWPLFAHLLDVGAHPILPCCRVNRQGQMDFLAVREENDLQKGAFNIPEPCREKCSPFPPQEADLFIIPGVAFDINGYRIGFGGGYYDRLLADSGQSFPPLIGAAYSFQLLHRIPREKWDQPVQYVITENETRECA